jgi:hypothetical protein
MFLPIDPIFVNHYLSQFASNQSFSQSMTMRCRQQTVLTFIRPVLEYACEVWDGCYERDIEKLEKIQLEAARIVTKFASKDSLYFETGWETLF